LTLPCADHENIVWRFVSEMISSAVIGAMASVVVMGAVIRLPVPNLQEAA